VRTHSAWHLLCVWAHARCLAPVVRFPARLGIRGPSARLPRFSLSMEAAIASRRTLRRPGAPLPAWPESRPLRAWQQTALDALMERPSGDFLAAATPAAGKTTFGLRVAHGLLRAGLVSRVAIVGPTAHICRQWASAAHDLGIDLEPNRANADGHEPPDRHGTAVTYQAVAAGPVVHRRATSSRPTLLIADEPHHMGDEAAWGRSAALAFGHATLRLLLSGTPFRSDNSAIPFVGYDENGVSRSDFAYGYTDALVEGVCRPITFMAYDGEMEWTAQGKTRHAGFDVVLPKAESARRLRTALDGDGDWIAHVLADADAKLTEVRAAGHADAGGLVVAADKAHAAKLAARLARIAGEPVEVVTSDDPKASDRIEAFSRGHTRWLVSVLMVSEGVDIPRLRVGVYATAARTELFFRQVVGRFVRRTPRPARQMSYLLLPADPQLKALAAKVEEERRHALELRPGLEEAFAEPSERGESDTGFLALSSSAHLEDVIRSSTQPGDALALFADADHPEFATPSGSAGPAELVADGSDATGGQPPEPPAYVLRERARDRRHSLVRDLARRTGESHATVHASINRVSGAPVADASLEQLERGNARLVALLAKTPGRRRGR
jgi:superfamily II DNA or RNA helicase